MKIRYRLYAVCMFLLCGFSSCYNSYHFRNDDVSVTIKESEDEYNMSASFDRGKTKMVENYISDHTGENGLFKSRGNIDIDANTTYDDDIKIYIKFHPGKLNIQFDKDDNSKEAYHEVKDMCEGIKEILTKP